MTTKTLLLNTTDFFHARPSARIAAAAKPFVSIIMVAMGTAAADAKDPLSLMRLGHPNGIPVDLLADGPDEQDALEAVLDVMEKEFTVEHSHSSGYTADRL